MVSNGFFNPYSFLNLIPFWHFQYISTGHKSYSNMHALHAMQLIIIWDWYWSLILFKHRVPLEIILVDSIWIIKYYGNIVFENIWIILFMQESKQTEEFIFNKNELITSCNYWIDWYLCDFQNVFIMKSLKRSSTFTHHSIMFENWITKLLNIVFKC